MNEELIQEQHGRVSKHPVYSNIQNISGLRHFTQVHVYAVWDFMSLLKRLQNDLTCTSVPWRPSPCPKEIVRFINEIVLGEECDKTPSGNYCDHFGLYLQGMTEIEASTDNIQSLINSSNITQELSKLPGPISEFCRFNIELATYGQTHQVAAAFFYGREKAIPDIFQGLMDNWSSDLELLAPTLTYYFKRHIELDEGEHGPMAKRLLDYVCENDKKKEEEVLSTAYESLRLRQELWDFALSKISTSH